MSMSDYEEPIKRFLRKISPDRDWMYIGEVEHAWMAELYQDLKACMGDASEGETSRLRKENETLREGNARLSKDLNAEHALVIALTYSDGGLKREIERAALEAGNTSLSFEMLECMKQGELLAEAKQLAKMLVFLCEQNERKAKLMQEIWSNVVAEHPDGDFPDMGTLELRMRGLGVEVE